MKPNLGGTYVSWALALLTVLAIALIACGGAAQSTEAPAPANTPVSATLAPTNTPVPQPMAETAAAASVSPTARPAPTTSPTAAPRPTNTPEPTPAPTEVPYLVVPGIVDPSNRGWPREVETSEGRITLEGPPQRILTYSLGHDEMVIALVAPERIAAIGKFATNDSYSNITEQASELPIFEKGAENVLAANPDLFIVSKFTKQDIVDLVKEAGVPVVRPALENSAEGNIPNILLMGYMFGTEERALGLVAEIRNRLALVAERVPPPGDESRPAVISISRYSDSISVSAGGTTGSAIVETAGGVDAAARDGLDGFQTISVESIAAMNPDFIIIPQAGDGAVTLRDDLLKDPVLASVPAIANGEVHIVDAPSFITLSHWNVRGIERTAEIMFSDRFADVTFTDFEPYGGE